MIPKEERCCYAMLGDWGHYTRCSRKGAVVEEGKKYCKQHAPSNVKERQAKAEAKRTEEYNKKWDREKLTKDIIAQAWKFICADGRGDPPAEYQKLKAMLEQYFGRQA